MHVWDVLNVVVIVLEDDLISIWSGILPFKAYGIFMMSFKNYELWICRIEQVAKRHYVQDVCNGTDGCNLRGTHAYIYCSFTLDKELLVVMGVVWQMSSR